MYRLSIRNLSDGDVPCFIDSYRGIRAEEKRNYGVSEIASLINWCFRAVCQKMFWLTSQSLTVWGNWSVSGNWLHGIYVCCLY
jgi:hypothetical protein